MARPKLLGKDRSDASATVLVIGLGRFGTAVAESLIRLNRDVMAIEDDPELVSRWSDELTDHAVVAIGADLEASVLTVLALAEAGVQDI